MFPVRAQQHKPSDNPIQEMKMPNERHTEPEHRNDRKDARRSHRRPEQDGREALHFLIRLPGESPRRTRRT